MPFDGCFVHYLVDEFKTTFTDYKINKIYQPTTLDVVLQLRGKNSDGLVNNIQLLISSRLDAPKIYISKEKYSNPEIPNNFCMLLRKYIERGIIKEIKQYQNDRIIEFHINTYNELQDECTYILLIELMGRNSNIILLNNDYQIIDAVRKLPPSLENERTIVAHAKYLYPTNNKQINPFEAISNINLLDFQGVSKPLFNQLVNLSSEEITNFLNQKLNPVIYQNDKKIDFYAYPLDKDQEPLYKFNTLSEMLEKYYELTLKKISYNTDAYEKIIKKELKKALHKLDNLNNDLTIANQTIEKNDLGILLQANLYKVKKGDTEIIVNNFLNNFEEITIPLNPMLEPSENLKVIFNKIKKAKNAVIEVNKQITILHNEINYLDTLLFQLSIADNSDIEEIKQEMINFGIIKNKNRQKKKNNKPTFMTYVVDGVTIYVGKNNFQNDFLTHKLGSSNDFWFHAKDIPGSHVIVKLEKNDPNFVLTENIIRTAANIAAYFSKAKDSSSVAVDYTRIKHLKKVPGTKGSFVTLSNQKTIYIDPDFNLFNKYLKNL